MPELEAVDGEDRGGTELSLSKFVEPEASLVSDDGDVLTCSQSPLGLL
jgi:hypothetical protein